MIFRFDVTSKEIGDVSLQFAGKMKVLLCTKYRHFPSYSVPLLIAKNKEIKGHFNGPPPPPLCPVIF
jgi:hypothetical protein